MAIRSDIKKAMANDIPVIIETKSGVVIGPDGDTLIGDTCRSEKIYTLALVDRKHGYVRTVVDFNDIVSLRLLK